jgi:hypothetical protein
MVRRNISFTDKNNELCFDDKLLIHFLNNVLFINTRRKTLVLMIIFISNEISKYDLSNIHNITLNKNMFDNILLSDIYKCDVDAIFILFNKIYVNINIIVLKIIKHIINTVKTKNEFILISNNQETIQKLSKNVSSLIDRLTKLLKLDIFQMSKHITKNLIDYIKKELIVKYKSYHHRLILRTLKKINLDMENFLLQGNKKIEIGMECEKYIYNKLTENIHDASKYVKQNMTIKNNRTKSIKPEFDIVIGNFENNMYLIDIVIDVKKSSKGIYNDIEKFRNGIRFLETNNVKLLDDKNNTYFKHPNQKNINKIYMFEIDTNNYETPADFVLNTFNWYVMNIKKNTELMCISKNYFYDLFKLIILYDEGECYKAKIKLNEIMNVKTIGKYNNETIKDMVMREINKFNKIMHENISDFTLYKCK